jgi:hypothetical protein
MTEHEESVLSSENTSMATGGYDFAWLCGWFCLLATVFLLGATMNCLFRWLPFGNRWDLAGTALSSMCAWVSYTWTLSRRAPPRLGQRVAVAGLMVLVWALAFPVVMYALGFS